MKMRIINIVLALWLIALGAKAQYLGVENSTLDSGQESEIVVNISGATSMTGVQLYLQLPAGVNFAQEGGDYGIVLGEATDGHTMSITPLGTGDYLVVLYSIYQETFGDGELLRIYSDDLSRELAVHPVTWSRKDSFCADQYADMQPVELPTAPVTTVIAQLGPPKAKAGFDKFDFEGRL